MIYDILYRTLDGAKPLRITFAETGEFIRVHNGTRYLVLFGPEKMMLFAIGLDTLSVKKLVLRMLFLIIMQELKMIQMILRL